MIILNCVNAITYRLMQHSPQDVLASLWKCTKFLERISARAFDIGDDGRTTNAMSDYAESMCNYTCCMCNIDLYMVVSH